MHASALQSRERGHGHQSLAGGRAGPRLGTAGHVPPPPQLRGNEAWRTGCTCWARATGHRVVHQRWIVLALGCHGVVARHAVPLVYKLPRLPENSRTVDRNERGAWEDREQRRHTQAGQRAAAAAGANRLASMLPIPSLDTMWWLRISCGMPRFAAAMEYLRRAQEVLYRIHPKPRRLLNRLLWEI